MTERKGEFSFNEMDGGVSSAVRCVCVADEVGVARQIAGCLGRS